MIVLHEVFGVNVHLRSVVDLMLYGLRDDIIPNEQADAVESALLQAGVHHEVVRYDAGHGFFCEARSSFDSGAAADAWTRLLGLLRETIGA